VIHFKRGDMFAAPVEALVNPVNTVGRWGKGLALEFHRRFPENSVAYERVCATGELDVGSVLSVDRGIAREPRWIINFPTKKHWRNPSTLEYIEVSLPALVSTLLEYQIRSVAVPALGCGLGGLDWAEVRPRIQEALEPLIHVEAWVFEPN
jgi:O-acetyl-ADP-ribose deacetylase (regulator of RNase III)